MMTQQRASGTTVVDGLIKMDDKSISNSNKKGQNSRRMTTNQLANQQQQWME